MAGSMVSIQVPGPLSRSKLGVVLTIWLLLVCLFGGLSTVGKWVSPVTGDRQDQCEKLNFTDESAHTGKVFEVQNTWSNAGYLLAGLIILFCSSKPLGLAVGVQLCVLAFFSGLYHATLQGSDNSIDAQMWDVAGIYFVLLALIVYGVQCVFVRRRLTILSAPPWLIEWIVAAILMVIGHEMAVDRTHVCLFSSTTAVFVFVAVLIVIVVYQMSRLGFNWTRALNPLRVFWPPDEESSTDRLLRNYFWAFTVFGVPAILFRLKDGHGRALCQPEGMLGFLQAHAMWHILSAGVLLVGYDFFAWSARSHDFPDYPVSGAVDPNIRPFHPSMVAAGFGAAFGLFFLLAALFAPDGVYDVPSPPEDPARCVLTGILIGSTFLAGALALFVLRLTGVIDRDA